MDNIIYPYDQRYILPNAPGVYKFYNSKNILIYVGKAIDLKKRVYSYFGKKNHNVKTSRLVNEIQHFNFVTVNNEHDALLLENNLIKTHQPKYNILLKDSKSYPYICIVNERFPRVITSRKVIRGYGKYFGPYSSVRTMYSIMELIKKLYPIRTCQFDLSKKK